MTTKIRSSYMVCEGFWNSVFFQSLKLSNSEYFMIELPFYTEFPVFFQFLRKFFLPSSLLPHKIDLKSRDWSRILLYFEFYLIYLPIYLCWVLSKLNWAISYSEHPRAMKIFAPCASTAESLSSMDCIP